MKQKIQRGLHEFDKLEANSCRSRWNSDGRQRDGEWISMKHLLLAALFISMFAGTVFAENDTSIPGQGQNLVNQIPGFSLLSWILQDIWHIILSIVVSLLLIIAILILSGWLKWVSIFLIISMVLGWLSSVIK